MESYLAKVNRLGMIVVLDDKTNIFNQLGRKTPSFRQVLTY